MAVRISRIAAASVSPRRIVAGQAGGSQAICENPPYPRRSVYPAEGPRRARGCGADAADETRIEVDPAVLRGLTPPARLYYPLSPIHPRSPFPRPLAVSYIATATAPR